MRPNWQRARQVHSVEPHEQRLLGRELWVKTGGPVHYSDMVSAFSDDPATDRDSYQTNLLANGGEFVYVDCRSFELLARTPDDFAEEVDPMLFEQWLAESADAPD